LFRFGRTDSLVRFLRERRSCQSTGSELYGLTGGGLYQFNIVVPDLPDGDDDVLGTIGGARSQRLARLRVQR
jgi:hypothetical protein